MMNVTYSQHPTSPYTKIKVTDLDTGESTVYDYSANNWARRFACMKDGLVYMWVPKAHGNSFVTSGRKWEIS